MAKKTIRPPDAVLTEQGGSVMVFFRGLPAFPVILRQNAGIHDSPMVIRIYNLVIFLLYSMISSYREGEHKPLVNHDAGKSLLIRQVYIQT
jgi:hypothetical protein